MIRKKQKSDKIVIDLTGQDGNAFCLLKYADTLSKKWISIKIKSIRKWQVGIMKTYYKYSTDTLVVL